jgi:hypothetical protein
MSVAYFGRPGLPDQLHAISLEYFFSALEILHAELPGAPLAVLGMSRGSEAAMLTAIHSAIRVRGVIAMVHTILEYPRLATPSDICCRNCRQVSCPRRSPITLRTRRRAPTRGLKRSSSYASLELLE